MCVGGGCVCLCVCLLLGVHEKHESWSRGGSGLEKVRYAQIIDSSLKKK